MSDKLLDIAKAKPNKAYKPKVEKKAHPVDRFLSRYMIPSDNSLILAEFVYNKYRLIRRSQGWPAIPFAAFCKKTSKRFNSTKRKKGTFYYAVGNSIDQSDEAFWEVRKYIRYYRKYQDAGQKNKKTKENNEEK